MSRESGAVDLRHLPSVDQVLLELGCASIARSVVADIVRSEIDAARQAIRRGERSDAADIVDRCRGRVLGLEARRLSPVLNGTGVILHTNLGRAPVSASTAEHMAAAASSYVPLEIDPSTNSRGGRMDEISRLMQTLTGADATLVVNNNAAALLLVLGTLAAGRDVLVSRSESIEIGGGFRIPEIVEHGGCNLREVGTTNRTYARDYERAVDSTTGAILSVHASNFRLTGFVAVPKLSELAAIARERGIPLIHDLGSGALLDTRPFGLEHEPTVQESLVGGSSIVCFSGDKLLGGPQAGIICGRQEQIERIARHPLARAVRADKSTLAGLAETLRHYIRGEALAVLPVWRMISASIEELRKRADAIGGRCSLAWISSDASVGGGSVPGSTLPSVAIVVGSERADELATRLRTATVPVFSTVKEGSVRVDLRTILPEHDHMLIDALNSLDLERPSSVPDQ